MREEFYFLEVNTRLQVEHPVTEAVFGIDLVEWMIRQAAGEDVLSGADALTPKGAAIEVRLYAEMPHADFRPSAGLLTEVVFPESARVDSWIETGTEVTPFYDPMLAKIIVAAEDRPAAIAKLQAALAGHVDRRASRPISTISAPSPLPNCSPAARWRPRRCATSPSFPTSSRFSRPGAQSSLQELPGRLGLWHVGVPPSGPMDERSFRHANRLVGNDDVTAALELTVSGPTLRFHADADDRACRRADADDARRRAAAA